VTGQLLTVAASKQPRGAPVGEAVVEGAVEEATLDVVPGLVVVARTGAVIAGSVARVPSVTRANAPRAERRARPNTEVDYRYIGASFLERRPKSRLIV
jgi:hypothetical protein